MPPEGLLTLVCLGPRPSLDRFDYVVITSPTEVGVALYHDPDPGERVLLNSDTVARTEIAEPMQIVFTCSADAGRVELGGEVDWALLEASVQPEDEPSTSFQAVGIRLDKNEESDVPATFILDNLAITE